MIGTAVALVAKLQTTVDGGLRITLDISARDHKIFAELLRRKAIGEQSVLVTFEDNPEEKSNQDYPFDIVG